MRTPKKLYFFSIFIAFKITEAGGTVSLVMKRPTKMQNNDLRRLILLLKIKQDLSNLCNFNFNFCSTFAYLSFYTPFFISQYTVQLPM